MSTIPAVLLLQTDPTALSLHSLANGQTLKNFKIPATLSSTNGKSVDVKDGKILLGGGKEGRGPVCEWDLREIHPLSTIHPPTPISFLSISPLSTHIIAGTADGRLFIFTYPTGILLRTISAHFRSITVIRWTSDGSAFVSASEDGGIRVWALGSILKSEDHEPWDEVSAHTLPIKDIVIGRGPFPRCRLWSCGLDGEVKMWELATMHLITSYTFSRTPISKILVDPLERFFLAVGEEKNGPGWIRSVGMIPGLNGRFDDLYDVSTSQSSRPSFRTPTKIISAHICRSIPYVLLTTKDNDKKGCILHVLSYNLQAIRSQHFPDVREDLVVVSVIETASELIRTGPALKEMGRIVSSSVPETVLLGRLEKCVTDNEVSVVEDRPYRSGDGGERGEIEKLREENRMLKEVNRKTLKVADDVWKMAVEETLIDK